MAGTDSWLGSYWPARVMLAVTILMCVWGTFHPDDLGFAVALGIFTWMLYEDKAAERRRTAPERARRHSRNLELTWLAQMGAEDYLRRTLIADLRKLKALRQAQAMIEEMLKSNG